MHLLLLLPPPLSRSIMRGLIRGLATEWKRGRPSYCPVTGRFFLLSFSTKQTPSQPRRDFFESSSPNTDLRSLALSLVVATVMKKLAFISFYFHSPFSSFLVLFRADKKSWMPSNLDAFEFGCLRI